MNGAGLAIALSPVLQTVTVMDDDAPILRIVVQGLEPLERRVDRALLTIGSDPAADLRLASVPARWAVLRRRDDGLEIRRLGVAGATLLGPGEEITVDGVRLGLGQAKDHAPAGIPMARLAEALAGAVRPDDALALLVEELIEATGADTGAIVLLEDDGYTVPVARHADGRVLDEADQLLSDTLVRDVLSGGARTLRLSNLASDQRYGSVASVISLKLSSVLCVPMRLGTRVLGALYLGHHDPRKTFGEAEARDLEVLAAMALPLLAQMRRAPAPAASPVDALLVGDSEPMGAVRALVQRVAPSDLSVLVLGETGTGKEVTARAIHAASPRAAFPMIALNCAAVPESLLAVELFGCKKGAYTGAISDRKGRIEAAHGSTLFLDEVGDMPLSMQVALLRVLEERAVTRVGENEERAVDFRLVAATSKDLDAEVEAGRFRKDLLYRLRELAVTLPPLRERGEDILLLAQLFLRQAERQLALRGRQLGKPAEKVLRSHRWEGNVRELRAVMRRASILCDGVTIEPSHLQLDDHASGATGSAGSSQGLLGPPDRPLVEARDAFVVRYVQATLDRYEGNREAASAALGISVRSLYRHLA